MRCIESKTIAIRKMRTRRMREAAGSRRWVAFGIRSFDLPVEDKNDPDHGKERFVKEHVGLRAQKYHG